MTEHPAEEARKPMPPPAKVLVCAGTPAKGAGEPRAMTAQSPTQPLARLDVYDCVLRRLLARGAGPDHEDAVAQAMMKLWQRFGARARVDDCIRLGIKVCRAVQIDRRRRRKPDLLEARPESLSRTSRRLRRTWPHAEASMNQRIHLRFRARPCTPDPSTIRRTHFPAGLPGNGDVFLDDTVGWHRAQPTNPGHIPGWLVPDRELRRRLGSRAMNLLTVLSSWGCKNRQIARHMQTSSSAIRRRRHRILTILREWRRRMIP